MRSQAFVRSVVALAAAIAPLAAFAESSVRWRSNLDAAKIEATQSNRLLLLHFTRKSCGPCKYLDDNVFSQPHVGPAVEQHFVPVRIDADTSPALAASFQLKSVPTEILLTPQGQVVANLPIPDKADAYLAQLQNVATHYAQTSGGGQRGAERANLNPAYAKLPVAAAPVAATVATPTNVQVPQTQGNPFMAAKSPQQAAPYAAAGQGGAAAAPPITPTPMTPPAGATQPGANLTAGAAAPYSPYGTVTPSMPANAMPRSYRNPAEVAATAAAVAPATVSPAAPPVASAPVQTALSAGPPNVAPVSASIPAPASAAATVAAAPAVAPPQLPAGSPPVGFEGYCPVTVKTQRKWVLGNPSLGVVHRGRTYLFASEAERQQFWADPDAYSPVFAGLDPVMLLEKQQSVEGMRRYNWEYGGLVYFFSSEETKRRFEANPASYAAGVRQAMNRIDAAEGGIIRR